MTRRVWVIFAKEPGRRGWYVWSTHTSKRNALGVMGRLMGGPFWPDYRWRVVEYVPKGGES